MKHDFICEKKTNLKEKPNSILSFFVSNSFSLSFISLFLQVDKRCGSDVNLLKPY